MRTGASAAGRKIGLYGGTFDPIHNGHLILAREAMEQLDLETVVFVPNAISPHKLQGAPAAANLRRQMVAAAIDCEPGFTLDDAELSRTGPSYTIDTVLVMRQKFVDAELFWLVGEDNVSELRTWHRIDELERLVNFVVFSREGRKAVHPYPAVRRQIEISATDIRARVGAGRSIRFLVPEAVREIIERNKIYSEAPHHI